MLDLLRRWKLIPVLPAMTLMMPPTSSLAPPELPTEIRAQLVEDVRSKLHQHYQTDAGAKADGCFDFRSFKHAASKDGAILVQGDFLLSGKAEKAHMGRVEIFYAAHDSGWSVLENYSVKEKEVPLHALVVQVKDGLSGEPLAGATVVARSGLRRSNKERTDAEGGVRLDLLQGTFQVFASHPGYHSSVTPHVEVHSTQQVKDIFLLPIEQP